jgi:hypothetical protein
MQNTYENDVSTQSDHQLATAPPPSGEPKHPRSHLHTGAILLQGNVIGIPTATAIDPQFKTPANGVGFAIPSNRVKFFAPQIIETGKVTHQSGCNTSVFEISER